jgi:hypothetical protein
MLTLSFIFLLNHLLKRYYHSKKEKAGRDHSLHHEGLLSNRDDNNMQNIMNRDYFLS